MPCERSYSYTGSPKCFRLSAEIFLSAIASFVLSVTSMARGVAVSPTWMVISAGKKDEGTNKGYKHPRLSTVRHLLVFAGEKTGPRLIDGYDAAKKQWGQVRIWGRLYVTAKDGTIVLSTDGSSVKKD